MGINGIIDKLIGYAEQKLALSHRDAAFARNTLGGILGLEYYAPSGDVYEGEPLSLLLRALCEEGENGGLFSMEDETHITDSVMGALMKSPAQVEEMFQEKLARSPKEATDWFYRYCIDADYEKKRT